jgi:hypothetical protein
MPDQGTIDQLAALQARVGKITKSRESIIRDTGVAERKFEEAIEKLKELGIDASGMDSKTLQKTAEELEGQLVAKVLELTGKVQDGEALVAKYQQLRGEG